jgi:tetratricopeptide (TPR) repeat protein
LLKGQEKVGETIDMLVHMKLEQGYPRPEFEEVNQLLTFIDPIYGKRKAYGYILDRYLEEKNLTKYLSTAREYIELVDPKDDEVLFQLARISFIQGPNKANVKESIKIIKSAISINQNDHRYFELLAQLYYERGMKNKAMDAVDNAVLLAKQNGKAYKHTMELEQMIREL